MQKRAVHVLSLVGMAVVLAAAASGCTRETPPTASYTVEEYLAKPDVMEAKLRECANNPGELRDTPDCVNVKAAAQQHGIGSRKKMEPLKFPSAEEMNASTKPAEPK